MAIGKLIKVNQAVADNTSSSLIVTGITNGDNSIYLATYHDIKHANNSTLSYFRLTVGGVPATSSTYKRGTKGLRDFNTFTDYSSNNNHMDMGNTGTVTGRTSQGTHWIYNAGISSAYTNITMEHTCVETNGDYVGQYGQATYLTAESHDGYSITAATGNIATGTLTLYRFEL